MWSTILIKKYFLAKLHCSILVHEKLPFLLHLVVLVGLSRLLMNGIVSLRISGSCKILNCKKSKQLYIHLFYSSTPFNREELASILKFGAEELFKEVDNEQDQKLQVR